MQQSLSLDTFSDLIGNLYQGPLETIPWATFLNQLNVYLKSKYVTFILRPPSTHVDGLMVNTTGTSTEAVASYNTHFFTLDPFVGLPNRQVVTLAEFVSSDDWQKSEFYKNFLEAVDVFHILGADINTCDGAQCRIRISRGRDDKPFGDEEKTLLAHFIPHLERSIKVHMQLNRIEVERNLYAGAVNQMAVGTIILDEAGKVLQTNQVADRLIQEKDGIKLVNDGLQVGTDRDTQEFRRLVKQSLLSQKSSNPSMVEALRVQRPSGRADLGIIVRSVPLSEWSEGKQCPTVVIFISDPEQQSTAPQEIVRALFDFTPAETQLAMLLANGLTLDEASEELGISRNTARAHLRSTFSKTGVTRQTMLVRLILRSVATLG
ncbi:MULTISPECIES: helix-turn-helix transcriptional regulator [Pseudomonas]|jgi:DNA-binding CsgD family transcriptional regulator/PAS domain-containing protein|uniref:DNA-binding CsgD family transcriptional regulator/PAS domain-containing protein n=1 Tax=Pseudomonas moraviensis TaxID=321662 RepID=A0A7Z0AWU4_9PSED|nr:MULTISPECIES: LuxR C-terminal-related transcriptional regulator [Pseudomonas]EJM31258.1 DNA-binding protein with HTH domain [Pseudomonas sp. GM25]MCU0091362.1 LuxR C-terminal-related transcriptional regulator [Pseudomonas koreensis]MDD1139370.1 LuxR C-terminal-related transcriptional regulator [Pseudomonas aphyarum]NYH11810.1 DNA-binding CsgD family transcriptional regulator/PAS domain-containing protein [Pseudomonas moraviensis]PCR94613.1 transcriptional regulator [Pseudomonas fluorescens]